MSIRVRNLGDLDPRAVSLPHGTEVITSVDRVHGERRVPQGSIGRVTRVDGDVVDVTVVGVGVFRYARAELVPRRVGQALYAHRRAEAWSALHGCVVLESVVGSRAWGLSGPDSDEDLRGVFAVPFSWSQGLIAPPEDLVSIDGSATYWATTKAIRQGLRADPNTLEMLFVESVRPTDEIGEWIIEARDVFVSSEIYGSFGRYALGQLRRLEQGLRLAEHRTVIVEWMRDEPTQTLDGLAEKLASVINDVSASREDQIHRAKQYIKQLYRSMHDQGLLDANELSALGRFAQESSAQFELPRELRPKNAYNLLRLIDAATRWLREGAPTLSVAEPLRSRLLAIKSGEVALGEVLKEAEAMVPDLESARAASKLPARPDLQRADALARRIGEEVARRWLNRVPGALGIDAPPSPTISWVEP